MKAAAVFSAVAVYNMVVAGIVAGGIGSRMGQYNVPKQFIELKSKPIIVHTVEKFLSSIDVDYVVIGVHKNWVQYCEDIKNKYFPDEKRLFITEGGYDRNATIKNIIDAAQEFCHASDDDIIITHDAVRPFVSLRIIKENREAAEKFGVCDTVVGSTDTIVRSSDADYITDIPVRNEMYQGQTPQSFRIGLFNEVYASMTKEELDIITDACKMFYIKGHKVKLVDGDVSNFKITFPFDYKMAKIMMEESGND